MKKSLFFLGLLISITPLVGCSLANRNVTVTIGKKIICSECNKLISYELIISQVPYSRAESMKPEIIKDICPACQIKKAETTIRQEIAGFVGAWHGVDETMSLTFKDDGSGIYKVADGEEIPFLWYRGAIAEFLGGKLPLSIRRLEDGRLYLFEPKDDFHFLLEREEISP